MIKWMLALSAGETILGVGRTGMSSYEVVRRAIEFESPERRSRRPTDR